MLVCLWIIWINKWVIEVLHPFTDLEKNGGFSSSHLYCYMPYVSFKAMIAYMKCKRFQIQRILFFASNKWIKWLVFLCTWWNRWKWHLIIGWCPCTPMNQFRHGANNLFSDSFYFKKISFNSGISKHISKIYLIVIVSP